ncbi:MAG: hypothetical protein RLZZ30_902 [Bacteroidota bacterium]|jgi:hypothetical protein
MSEINLAVLKTWTIFAAVLTKGVNLHNNHLHKY